MLTGKKDNTSFDASCDRNLMMPLCFSQTADDSKHERFENQSVDFMSPVFERHNNNTSTANSEDVEKVKRKLSGHLKGTKRKRKKYYTTPNRRRKRRKLTKVVPSSGDEKSPLNSPNILPRCKAYKLDHGKPTCMYKLDHKS